jgi:hypothetical protein
MMIPTFAPCPSMGAGGGKNPVSIHAYPPLGIGHLARHRFFNGPSIPPKYLSPPSRLASESIIPSRTPLSSAVQVRSGLSPGGSRLRTIGSAGSLQPKYGANESRHRGDAGRFPRDRWFESGFLQRRVCEPVVSRETNGHLLCEQHLFGNPAKVPEGALDTGKPDFCGLDHRRTRAATRGRT